MLKLYIHGLTGKVRADYKGGVASIWIEGEDEYGNQGVIFFQDQVEQILETICGYKRMLIMQNKKEDKCQESISQTEVVTTSALRESSESSSISPKE